MTGPEHYREAEGLMRRAAGRDHDDLARDKMAAAQVHATLALAAATALPLPRAMVAAEYGAWADVAGERTEPEASDD